MYIYKITNNINQKIYIGQVYNKSIYDRFERHCKEAQTVSKSYIDRAINKYGKENFSVELIDFAKSLDELNEKEKYWIAKYNSTDKSIGYNLTDGGDGGNTYKYKSAEELNEIKDKISKANRGKNNGMSKQIKAYNYITKEELHFETLHEACQYFNHRQKSAFVNHAEKKAKYWWRNEWTFAYEGDEYNFDLTTYDSSCRCGIKIKATNTLTNEEIIFNSINKCNSFFNVPKGYIQYSNNGVMYESYLLQMI